MQIDDLDERILRALESEAGMSNLDLAKQVHASPATCLRRVARLIDTGVIQKIVALLDPAALGTPLTALIEVSLDRQDADALDRFEERAVADATVRQCYRMSAGIDFALLVYVKDMEAYHAFAHRLLGADANVRNVRALFSTHCAKFDTRRLAEPS